MWQKKRQQREQDALAEKARRDRRDGRSLPVAEVATRSTFIHSVVDPRLVSVDKVPDLEALRERDPDIAAALEGIYVVLAGVVRDTEFLHRDAPQSHCNLVGDVSTLVSRLESALKKVDNDKRTFRLFGREIPYKQTMVIGVVVVVARLYIPALWNITMFLWQTPSWWPWLAGGISAAALMAVGFLVWRRRRRR